METCAQMDPMKIHPNIYEKTMQDGFMCVCEIMGMNTTFQIEHCDQQSNLNAGYLRKIRGHSMNINGWDRKRGLETKCARQRAHVFLVHVYISI